MNNKLTDILVVLDRSGSMGKIRSDVIGGFNSFIEDQKKCPGDARLTLVQFSTGYETIYKRVPIQDVQPLTESTFVPMGWTAMLDAIINGIDELGVALSDIPEEERPGKVVVVIITDGEENRSVEFPRPGGYDVCRQKVQHQTDVYSWEFIFLAANQDAVLNGVKLGVKPLMAKTYTANNEGAESMYSGMSQALCAMRCDKGEAEIQKALDVVK